VNAALYPFSIWMFQLGSNTGAWHSQHLRFRFGPEGPQSKLSKLKQMTYHDLSWSMVEAVHQKVKRVNWSIESNTFCRFKLRGGSGSLSTMQREIMLHRLPIDSLDSVVFADKTGRARFAVAGLCALAGQCAPTRPHS
jgi:hypothetical protein